MKLDEWKDVARLLGQKQATVSAWRKRNTPSAVSKILRAVGDQLGEEYLLYGDSTAKKMDSVARANVNVIDSDVDSVNIHDMIDTVYGSGNALFQTAMAYNARALFVAVRGERQMKDEIAGMRHELKSLKELVQDLVTRLSSRGGIIKRETQKEF